MGIRSTSELLLQKQIPDSLPSNLGNACRSLARQVMDVLEISEADAGQRAHGDAPAAVSAPPAAVLPEGYASTAHH